MSDKINEWTPGDPCCGCNIRTIDFTTSAWQSSATVVGNVTQTANGIEIAPGARLTLADVQGSNAPLSVQLDAESAADTHILKLRWEIKEDGTLKETAYVEAASAAELQQAFSSLSHVYKVRLGSNGEAYWQAGSRAAQTATTMVNYMRLVIGSDQYWAGEWAANDLDPYINTNGSLILISDNNEQATGGTAGSAVPLITSPRTAGSSVGLTLQNDSDVDMRISSITLNRMNTPEVDQPGRETCVTQPIVCAAVADRGRPRWTDCIIDFPTFPGMNLAAGYFGCTAGFSHLYEAQNAGVSFQYTADGLNQIEKEFTTIQYDLVQSQATIQETANPSELQVTVQLSAGMLGTYQVAGGEGASIGSNPTRALITATYVRTITKPAAFVDLPTITLTDADLTAFTISGSASYPAAGGTEAYALSSLSHGAGTPTGIPAKFWVPGVTWDGTADGKAIDGTLRIVDAAFINEIAITLGQHVAP